MVASICKHSQAAQLRLHKAATAGEYSSLQCIAMEPNTLQSNCPSAQIRFLGSDSTKSLKLRRPLIALLIGAVNSLGG